MDKLRALIQESKEETSLIEKKSENIFVRFFKKLKSFFIFRLDKDYNLTTAKETVSTVEYTTKADNKTEEKDVEQK